MPRAAAQNRRLRDAARRRILDGSVAAFAEKGFHAASMEDVANSAGVSKGLAYHYFASKEELLTHALRERVSRLFEIGTAIDPAAPAADRLRQLVSGLFENVQGDPDVFRLYVVLSLDTSLSGAARQALHDVGGSFEVYLAAVRAVCADLGAADPELDALLLRSALLGIFVRHVRGIEEVPMERLCARLLELFAGGPRRSRRRS